MKCAPFDSWLYIVAFCPSIFKLSFRFCFFPFSWVPSLVRSISMTLRQIYFLQCSSCRGRFRWPWGKFNFCSALTLMGSISLTLRHEFDFYSALTSIGSISLTLRHEIIFCSGSLYDIQTPGFLEILLQIVHWHVFVCAPDSLLSPWNGFQHQKGLCETKHSPAWAMANMVPMWPQDSCFSLVVAGVGGLPFRWHDACLPQWSLQTRNWTFGTQKPDIVTQELSLSPSSFLKLLTTFDYFLTLPITCPNNRTW